MNEFVKKYSSQGWFSESIGYLLSRRIFIQNRLVYTFRYIDLDENNSKTFSYEYASILRDIGSVFSSVMHAYIVGSTGKAKKTDINDYRKLLLDATPNIHNYSVALRPHKAIATIIPLSSFKSHDGIPMWWTAYNKIKHSEYDSYRSGNLGNSINALAALKILEHFSGLMQSDDLWVNVGINYPETDPSYKNRPFKEHE